MFRHPAESASSSDDEAENTKLILTKRVKERVSDPRLERLKRAELKKLQQKHREETSQATVLYDPNQNQKSFDNDNPRGARLQLMDAEDDSSTRGRRGRGRPSKASGYSPLKLPDTPGKRLSSTDLQQVCQRMTAICSPSSKRPRIDEDIDDEPDPSSVRDAEDDEPELPEANKRQSVPEPMTPLMLSAEDYLKKPPVGVLGAGKGDPKGLPAFEFNSLYQYQLPSKEHVRFPAIRDPAKVPDDIELRIKSMVGVACMGCNLDLQKAAELGTNLTYDPTNEVPMVMRLKKPNSSAMIFKSGRIVINGTKTEKDCKDAAVKYVRIFKGMGFPAKLLTFRIVNISATCNVQFKVRIHLLARDVLFKNCIEYHPEMHTACCIRLAHPKSTVMVFCTGSLLITGVRNEEELRRTLQIVYPLIRIYAN